MSRKKLICWLLAAFAGLGVQLAFASITIPMYMVTADGSNKSIGSIKAEDSTCGVLFTPNLHDLPPGLHGFHIHENPSCLKNGMAAGSHLDPNNSGMHLGPYMKSGHLGDLPVLIVNKDGTATLPILAPHIELSVIKGHSLMIHVGEDNYSDKPEKNGGGGDRMACGVINAR